MNFTPEPIGVGKYTGELARWLAARGHTIEVITAWPHYPGFVRHGRTPAGRSHEGAVAVVRCPLLLRRNGGGLWRLVAPLSFAISAAPVVLWRALRSRPDLILCIEPTLLAAPAAILAAKLTGAKLALHVQDLEVDAAFATRHLRGRRLQALAFRLERRVLAAFDGVVTISDAIARRLAGKGVSGGRITVIRNWIDAPAASGPGTADVRRAFGIAPDEKLVLYAGHLGIKQGVPLLIEALRRLAARRAVRIVIVGAGPMAPLVAAARQHLPGLTVLPLQPPAIHRALLATADAHVLPQDGCAGDLVFPSKLGPMLASGRPVVAAADPSSELARWLRGAARVVPAGDPEALASGIAAALDDPPDVRTARALALAQTLRAEILLPAFEATLVGLIEAAPADVGDRPWRPAALPEAGEPQRA